MQATPQWSESTLREQVGRHDWYQSIDLGQGVVTPGTTGEASRNKLAMMDLPKDLSGKKVLDIGCSEGFFSYEAEARGASQVVAVEQDAAALEKFQLVHSVLNSSVELRDVSFLEIDPEESGRFDVVFFLAVLHHVRHPYWVLDHVCKLTRGFAVLELVEAVPNDGSDISAFVRRLSKRGRLNMLPTRTLTLELLERAGFARVEVLGAHRAKQAEPERRMPGFSQQRVLFKAHRKA